MQHCDPELLALRALGEPVAAGADDEHLAGCPLCRAELGRLRAVVETSRASGPDELVEPPAYVWDRIASELGIEDRRANRWRTPGIALAAAVAGIAAGIGGTVLLAGEEPEVGPDVRVVAQAVLEPLDATSATGTARVEDTVAGRRLVVETAGISANGAFLEVWLLDPATGALVSLGVLPNGAPAAYLLPDGLDLASYPAVDISREPLDGDPGHSGASLLRGTISG